MLKKLVIDVETNGIGAFRPPSQTIVQLAYGAFERADDLRTTSRIVRGAREVHPAAHSLHGISVERCDSEGVELGEAVAGLLDEMEHCGVVVGHNVQFDIGCILHNLAAAGLAGQRDRFKSMVDSREVFCTMKSGTFLCALPAPWGGYKYPKLEELYRELYGQVPSVALHDAENDCAVTAACYERL